MASVTVVGSANLDLVARVARIPGPGETLLASGYAEHPGGKGLNQAVAAARSGASVRFVGAVGDDAAGRRLRELLVAEGIDPILGVSGLPTGRALISVDDHAENAIVVVPGANTTVMADLGAIGGTVGGADVALFQLEVPIEVVTEAAVAASAAGGTVVVNPAPARHLPDRLVSVCDVLVPNEHEVELLGGAEALLRRGAAAVVVTLGAAGADLITAAGRERVDPFPVGPVDTTGAGDAFCGALAARLAGGAGLRAAVTWAAAAGALATTVPGAVPAQPTAPQIQAFIDSGA